MVGTQALLVSRLNYLDYFVLRQASLFVLSFILISIILRSLSSYANLKQGMRILSLYSNGHSNQVF